MAIDRTDPLWTANAELGADVAYQPDGSGMQTVLQMAEWGMPSLWSVALGLSFDPALVSGIGDGQFAVDGLIQFGSGRATQEFELDWAEGTTFSIPANAIKIVARYSDFAGKNNTPVGLRLRANLALGGTLQNHVTKTLKIRVPKGPGAFVHGIPIPRFARRLSIQPGLGRSNADVGAWSSKALYHFMGGLGPAGETGGLTGDQYLNHFAPHGIDIPSSARGVRIQNQTADEFWALLVFHLSF